MNKKTEDFVHNTGKSGGEPRLKFGGRVLVAVGILALIVGIVAKIGDDAEVEQGNELEEIVGVEQRISQPSTSTSSLNLPPPPPTPTSRGTCVYTVVDSKDKVHTAFKESEDIRVVGFVGRAKAIVEVSEKGKAQLEANPRLTFEGVPEKTFKDIKLRAGELTVIPLRTEDIEIIERVVKANGGEVKARCGVMENPNLRIVATGETIAALMALPEARWIENYEMPVFFNYESARTMKVNECWPTSAGDDCGTTGLNLTGKGQLLTTCDSGIDTANHTTMIEDLRDNVIGFAYTYGPSYVSRTDINGHGTHTAGSIVGTGAKSNGQFKGMAYEAKLWAWMGGDVGGSSGSYVPYTIDEAFRPIYQSSYADCGMVSYIYSASYGSDGESYRGRYLSDSAEIDEYCWEHPDFLPCWAAANSGSSEGTLSTQACAKNALVVGASNGSVIAYLSSRGPTMDGRIKPDIVTPGMNISSCNSTQCKDSGYGNYIARSGTSMATPLTAGVCALLRQWLVEREESGAISPPPSSAMMKAILMGGATKLMATAKTAQGEGRINLRASIAPEDGLGIFIADWIALQEGERVRYDLETTEDAPFDAQLVWVDYPGTVTSDQTAAKLVNDLDLRVERAGGGEVWLGNGGTTPDRLNNAENIHDATFPKGRYRIIIEGNNISESYGGAGAKGAIALYVRGAFDGAKVRPYSKPPPTIYFK